jgi:hypothetical protein
MQFHPTGTDPTREALLVCRNARWNLLVLLLIFWTIPVFWWYVAAPWWVTSLWALPALLTWPVLGTWRKRGRADNWVLALYRDGVWLNLRDCEYHDAEPAQSVLFVPYQEIAAARRYLHCYTTPSSDGGDTLHKDVYLVLLLNATDLDELRITLEEERRREPPMRSYFGGVVTASTKRTQAPVELEGNSLLHVKFTVSNYGLRPPLKKVLGVLQRFVMVDVDRKPLRDEWEKLDNAEFETLVRRLVKNGARIDAIRLLQERKRLSTTDASQYVDALEAPITP